MNMFVSKIALVLLCLVFLPQGHTKAPHNHEAKPSSDKSSIENKECEANTPVCAKTITSAFAPNGDLWRVWVAKKRLYFQISKNNGASFSTAQTVEGIDEKISARNENRPKIAFDNAGGVYLSWATPREKKYTADVRFSYSSDYGQSFTSAITVNNDNLLTGHSFNEMMVTGDGDISIVWLDGRHKTELRKQGKKANGSALYLGKANYLKGQKQFSNLQLANNTCVCCRLAIDSNLNNQLSILWRHIYGDNIREFALLTVNKTKKNDIIQISHDHWKINGCPHQGGGLSIDEKNIYHMAWFNMGDQGKGIFYAQSSDLGKTLSKPLSIGDINFQAAHPHIMANENIVDIVWTQFDGEQHQLWHQRSNNKGQSFGVAKSIANASFGADRPFIIKSGKANYVSWQRPKKGHWVMAL